MLSNDTLLTNVPQFNLTGMTRPGAVVAVDRDGDGAFNDGTTTADPSGNYALDVTLLHNDANRGANRLTVRASDNGQQVEEEVNAHLALGTVVRFDSDLGAWDVELLDADAPNTVGAFLADLSRYDDTFVHRNILDFVIQGGGFGFDAGSSEVIDAPPFPAPPNEFDAVDPPNSNLRGTLSTAQTADPNTFTGQWFVSTGDNSGLDSVPHTVFGRVVGSGMDVVDAINQTPSFAVGGTIANSGALSDVPLENYAPMYQPISGQVSVSPGNRFVSGVGTSFTSQLAQGQGVRIAGEELAVSGIFSDVLLQLVRPHLSGASGVEAARNTAAPAAEQFVTIRTISKVLEPAETDPNTFLVFENSAAGTGVGQVVPADGMGLPMIFEFYDPTQNDPLRLVPDDHLAGDPAAPVVLIEYLDLACPACAAIHPTVEQLKEDFEGELLVVSRHFPLTGIHPNAFDAAIASEAAARQGMFHAMVDILLTRQNEWAGTSNAMILQAQFEGFAVDLGLNLAQFRTDQADPALAARVNRDLNVAQDLALPGTPTFFLQGEEIATPASPQAFDAVIQAAVDAVDQPFALHRQDGRLTVRDNTALDFEVNPSFLLEVQVQNGSAEIVDVMVNVIDVFGE
ncbi:MAG: thioredoxin domain-containing protein [Planctomycetales bacterium]|nr:thioredoxin domain-containing protein [Planctomycetales bacterium]